MCLDNLEASCLNEKVQQSSYGCIRLTEKINTPCGMDLVKVFVIKVSMPTFALYAGVCISTVKRY